MNRGVFEFIRIICYTKLKYILICFSFFMLANRTCLTPLNMPNLTVFACSKTFNSNYAVETYSNHFS